MRLKEQEELDLAIALSLSEDNKRKNVSLASSNANQPRKEEKNVEERESVEKESSPVREEPKILSTEPDNDLQKYLDRSYWEKRNAHNEAKNEETALRSYSQAQGLEIILTQLLIRKY